MKIDPASEVAFRAKLAKGYLERARKFLALGDYKECVEAAQLSAENAAKAVIALKRVPSWTHDPSDELLEVSRELPERRKRAAEELAGVAHELAPEHGVATYGRPAEGLAPWEIYGEEDARRALEKARRAVELMEHVLEQSDVEAE